MDDKVVVIMELRPCGRIVVVPVRFGEVTELAWPGSPGSPCTHVHTGFAVLVDRLGAAVTDTDPEAPAPAADTASSEEARLDLVDPK
jgi:hypothetical protein